MIIDGKPVASWLPPEIWQRIQQDRAFNEKYVIESKLGSGGSGVVVAARHRELDERVAIKFLLSGVQNDKAVARLRFEARAAHRIKSEHVVRIIDVCTTETGVPYIVMEYLEGLDLERMLQQSPDGQLPFPDAIEFILQACEAVAESHGLGIVHRDLKPSNLFCIHGADGLPMIKVLDFGISKFGFGSVDREVDLPSILGSPRYMSPEQFDSPTDVDPRTDIWAIGVVLYEILTGELPFSENDLYKLRQRIRLHTPRPPCQLRPDIPASLSPVVMKCLEKNRDKRYPNVAELAKALIPFAPPRCRSSALRIVRIVESPGMTTGSVDLPPAYDSTASEAPTARSVPPRSLGWGKTRVDAVLLATAAVALSLLVAWLVGRASSSAVDAARIDADSPPVSLVASSGAPPSPAASQEITTLPEVPAAPTLFMPVRVSPTTSGPFSLMKPSESKLGSVGHPPANPPPVLAKSVELDVKTLASGPLGAGSTTPKSTDSATSSAGPAIDAGSTTRAPSASSVPLPASGASSSPHYITDIVPQRKIPK
jgi:serine/threonine-protein kinase